jgi:hypothetical protein
MKFAVNYWSAAEWALANIRAERWSRPWVVTFEYGGVGPGFTEHTESAVLAAQVPRLFRLVHAGGSDCQSW